MKAAGLAMGILAGLWTMAGSAPAEPLRVVTYNIYGGRGRMADDDLAALTQVLRTLKPDLVALQEVDRNTARSGRKDVSRMLGKSLGMHSLFGSAMPLTGGEYGDAILSRWPMTPAAHVALPSSPDREERTLIAARIEIPGNQGGPIWFGSTHFDHRQGDTDRLPQAKAVVDAIQQAGMPGVVAGDFNCEPDSEPFRVMSAALMDTRKDHPRPTYSSEKPRINIDGVLATPQGGWRVMEAKTGTEVMDHDPEWAALLRRASDHLPVLVVLERATTPENPAAASASGESNLPDRFRDGVADTVHDAR